MFVPQHGLPAPSSTNHGERLIAAGRAADDDFGEDLSQLTPEQMAAS